MQRLLDLVHTYPLQTLVIGFFLLVVVVTILVESSGFRHR